MFRLTHHRHAAKDVGSESERTADDFISFLKSLIDAGYTKLNIIAHSMGARVFFSSLNKGLFDEVFLVRLDNHLAS
jgi:hypothetical protein